MSEEQENISTIKASESVIGYDDFNFDHRGLNLKKVHPIDKFLKKFIFNPFTNYVGVRPILKAFWFITRSSIIKSLYEGPGSWEAMLTHYNVEYSNWMDKIINRYNSWPQALRNRQQLVVNTLQHIIQVYGKNQTMEMVAIGSGSGNNILESIYKEKDNIKGIQARLFDLSQEAIDYGNKKSVEFGLNENVKFIQSEATEVKDKLDIAPHLTKMIGLVEYMSDEAVDKLFSHISQFRNQSSSSILISSNEPKHGIERFLNKTMNFYLNYRSPETLKKMLSKYGYKKFHVFPEPSGIFNLIVAHTH